MDIVRRAYATLYGVPVAGAPMRAEVIRLIQGQVYDRRAWPREWGPLPEELRAKRTPRPTETWKKRAE